MTPYRGRHVVQVTSAVPPAEGRLARVEKRGRWEFTIPEGGAWGWRVTHPDGRYACADREFRTLKDCIDDAKNHGYVYGLRRGATMHDLAKRKSPGETVPPQPAPTAADAIMMSRLLRDFVSCNAGDAELIERLQQDARKVLERTGV